MELRPKSKSHNYEHGTQKTFLYHLMEVQTSSQTPSAEVTARDMFLQARTQQFSFYSGQVKYVFCLHQVFNLKSNWSSQHKFNTINKVHGMGKEVTEIQL